MGETHVEEGGGEDSSLWDTLPHLAVFGFCPSEVNKSLPASEVTRKETFQVMVQGEVQDVFKEQFVVDCVKCFAQVDCHKNGAVNRLCLVKAGGDMVADALEGGDG